LPLRANDSAFLCEQKSTKKYDLEDVLDTNTFDQILEMDDPDSDEFSRSIVTGFLEQAEETFVEMDDAL
jgi:osomolarity two-component system phosphorelay intermediate protein YPD1